MTDTDTSPAAEGSAEPLVASLEEQAERGVHVDEHGLTVLPMTSMTLDRARSRLSGWHFSKECLSDGEREILYVAEALMRLVDARDPRGYAR